MSGPPPPRITPRSPARYGGRGAAPLRPAAAHHATYLRRAAFLRHALWVTAYAPDERFPAGDFPNQRSPHEPDGLEKWSAADRPIDGADVVLWHVFGVHHAVRLEDAPVMPSIA